MKILIADDHAVVRRGLKEILEDHFPDLAVGEAATAPETLEAINRQPWDLLLLDLKMPGRGGLDVLHAVRQSHPRLPVLVLSMHPEEAYGARVLKAGAAGYLTKESAPQELVAAVRKVTAGGQYVSPALTESLVAALRAGTTEVTPDMLSDREFQVLALLGAGKTVKQISIELSLSIKTISTYRTRLLEKLRLRTTGELIHYAIQHGLAE